MNRRLIFVSVAGIHVLLVACGAFRWNVLPAGTVPDASVRLYMVLSGADGYYGFFAPGVGPQIRIRLKMIDAGGRETFSTLRYGESSEANLRMVGVGRLLPNLDADQNRILMQSLAAATFNRHREAERVECLVELYGVSRPHGSVEFPTMEEYRDGMRPSWIKTDSITFTRPASHRATADVASADAATVFENR